MISAGHNRPLLTAWIIWYAILLHATWAVLLLAGQTNVTGVTAVHEINQLLPSPIALGLFFMAVGGFAFAALVEKRIGWRSLLLLLPQQFTLVLSATGALNAMYLQHFADGVHRPLAFLIADQLPAILAAAGHTAAIIHLHLRGARV